MYGCKSGYKQSQGNVPSFHFPANESSLFKKWVSFVNRTNWKPSANSVICAKHFLGKLICDGSRKTSNWSLNPIPTLHTQIAFKIFFKQGFLLDVLIYNIRTIQQNLFAF